MLANGLDAYAITVRQTRDKAPKLLGSFDGEKSLLDVIYGILKKAEPYHHQVTVHRKCVTFENIKKNGDSITGLAYAGEYGFGNNLIDISSGKTTYKKKQTDASMIPFFFEWYLPARHRKGILLSQRIGQSGVRTLLEAIVSPEFDAVADGYLLGINPVMPEAAIKALLKKATLHEVRFVQSMIPSDIADRFNGTNSAQEGEVEFIIRPRRKGYLKPGAIIDFLSGKKTVGDLIEIQSFTPDNVKVEIGLEGRRRVIDFGKLGRLRSSFDISADIKLGPDGYGTLTSLRSASADLVQDLAEQLKIKS
jgi:hypothetical protein